MQMVYNVKLSQEFNFFSLDFSLLTLEIHMKAGEERRL